MSDNAVDHMIAEVWDDKDQTVLTYCGRFNPKRAQKYDWNSVTCIQCLKKCEYKEIRERLAYRIIKKRSDNLYTNIIRKVDE